MTRNDKNRCFLISDTCNHFGEIWEDYYGHYKKMTSVLCVSRWRPVCVPLCPARQSMLILLNKRV